MSDWREYWGSNIDLQNHVKEFGEENFKREILSLHKTQGAVNYTEIEEQFVRGVVDDPTYYNESINGKFRNVRLDLSTYSTDSWRDINKKNPLNREN